jgi:hypothetical protein
LTKHSGNPTEKEESPKAESVVDCSSYFLRKLKDLGTVLVHTFSLRIIFLALAAQGFLEWNSDIAARLYYVII